MINSIINRRKKTIVLDKVIEIIDEKSGDIKLVTSPNEVKHLTNKHFQTIAGGQHQTKTIPEEWRDTYTPKTEVNENIYNFLMTDITDLEWFNTISNLPNNKAPGPSGITYEMIKHTGDLTQQTLRKFINACIHLNDIPSAWRHANVFPIPKPKEFECNLVNTRPITLLEVVRKIMVKILTNRLSNILSKNKVLNHTQFAGLPYQSTFQPTRILNEIIEDSLEQKKELWIMSQDMSKAYDRVNIFMLEKALLRLKIPHSFTQLILNLFRNRKNQIFTAVGITEPYDVLIGIDQGEIISPLLWVIYYDPLLTKIQQLNLGYTLSHSFKQDLYNNETITLEVNIPQTAYMDDTTWLSNSKQNLEQILQVADSFNELNHIQVNKEKSRLLLSKSAFKYVNQGLIDITYGQKCLSIKPLNPNESMKILGVWFNMNKDRKFNIQLAKTEMQQFVRNIKYKRLTDKQMIYVYNSVIIPRIEYRTQLTHITNKELRNISSIFLTAFKHKINLSKTTPNSLLNIRQIYSYRDLTSVVFQSKISNFTQIIEEKGLLNDIINIRLRQIQNQELLTTNPILSWPYQHTQKSFIKSHIKTCLTYCKNHQITFQTRKINNIGPGTIPIRDGFPTKEFEKYKKSLSKYNIFYIDQLSTIDGQYLINKHDIRSRNYSKIQRIIKIPRWFTYAINNWTTGLNQQLLPKYTTPPTSSYKGYRINFPMAKNEIFAYYNENTHTTLLGKIKKINNDSSTVSLSHCFYISNNWDETIIQNCNGCNYRNISSNTSWTIPCNIIISHHLGIIIPSHATKKRYHQNDTLHIGARILKISKYDIQLMAQLKYYLINNIPLPNISNTPQQTIIKNPKYKNWDIIYRLIHTQSPVYDRLIRIRNSLPSSFSFDIYTDGSLIDIGKESVSMSSGFIITNVNPPIKLSFKHSDWPSSTKAELVAINVALITLPSNSTATIYTDSLAVINHYNNITDLPVWKHDCNKLDWIILSEIISSLNLTIKFIKVKAHSDDIWNNAVDRLAQNAHIQINNEIEFNYQQNTSCYTTIFWRNKPIQLKTRKFIKFLHDCKHFEEFLHLNRFQKYLQHNINWTITWSILQDNEEVTNTSFKATFKKAHKLKLMFEELPTLQKMKIYCPDLYQDWRCPFCQDYEETFQHIWTCSYTTPILTRMRFKMKILICGLIQKFSPSHKKLKRKDLSHDIFNINYDASKLSFSDIIKGVVPEDMVLFIQSYIKNIEITKYIISFVWDQMYQNFLNEIWKVRIDIIRVWEFNSHITSSKKKSQKSRNNNSHSLTINSQNNNNILHSYLLGIDNMIGMGGQWETFYNSYFTWCD
jgi:ribonuclease HI